MAVMAAMRKGGDDDVGQRAWAELHLGGAKVRGEQTAGGLRGPVDLRGIPSGKLAVCYGKWPIEIDGLPIKNGDFL